MRILSKRPFKNKHETDEITISKIEASQLEHTNNDVSVYDRVNDTSKDFAKLDDVTIGTKGDSEFAVMPEMQRFSKKHDIPESVKVTGTKSTK